MPVTVMSSFPAQRCSCHVPASFYVFPFPSSPAFFALTAQAILALPVLQRRARQCLGSFGHALGMFSYVIVLGRRSSRHSLFPRTAPR